MTDREAMKLALDALEGIHVGNMTPMAEENWNKAIAVLRKTLEKPEREWVNLMQEDMPDGDDPVFDSDEFILGMAWAQTKLKEKNSG